MELFARKIENLTDARYFAAWNIDYLSFEIPHADGPSSISMADITEIKNWLSGPSYIGEYAMGFSWEEIERHNEQLDLDHICIDQFFDFDQIPSTIESPIFIQCHIDDKEQATTFLEKASAFAFPFHLILSSSVASFDSYKDVIAQINQLNTNKKNWLDFPITSSDAEKLDSTHHELGICFRGGMEEKVGVKSFDQLDEIFDILESKGLAGF